MTVFRIQVDRGSKWETVRYAYKLTVAEERAQAWVADGYQVRIVVGKQ